MWPEIQYSRQYGIRHCGSNATKVDAALKVLRRTLQPAIQDSTQIPSSAAYKTFFKDTVNSKYIKAILSNITTGVQMPLKGARRAHSNAPGSREIQRAPEIICISRRGQLLYHLPNHNGVLDHYDACKQRIDGGTSAYMAGTPYIVLCPSFFTLDLAPSEPICPHLNKWTNRYTDSYGGKSIIHFQIFALLHGIAQFYIFATSAGLEVQANGINECSTLAARHARENARSYEFYVASKSILWISCAIHIRIQRERAKCSQVFGPIVRLFRNSTILVAGSFSARVQYLATRLNIRIYFGSPILISLTPLEGLREVSKTNDAVGFSPNRLRLGASRGLKRDVVSVHEYQCL